MGSKVRTCRRAKKLMRGALFKRTTSTVGRLNTRQAEDQYALGGVELQERIATSLKRDARPKVESPWFRRKT